VYQLALAFSALCFAAVTFAFVRSRAFSAFHPLTVYLIFHGFVFVIRPIIAYLGEFTLVYRLYQFTPSPSDRITALLVSTLGLLAFAATCWRAGPNAMAFRRDRVAEAEQRRLQVPFLWVAALCIPIGIYSLATVWETAMSTGAAFSNMVRDGVTGTAFNDGTSGYLVEAQLMLASCAAIIAWLFRFRIYALLPLVLFVLYRAGTGSRGAFITALFSVLLFYLYDRGKRWPPALILAAVPLALLAFTAVGDDRGASIRRTVSSDGSSELFSPNRDGERLFEGMDFANLEYLEFMIYVVPQRSGTYGYFNGVLQVFTEPVPREIWKDKPIGPPFERINIFDYGNPRGITRSLPGEGWFALGWLGTAIWCGAWGWALGAIYRRFVNGSQSTLQVAAYMVFIPILIVAFRDGQLVTVFRQGLFFMMPIALWWALARLLGIPSASAVRRVLDRRAGSATPRHQPGVTDGGDGQPARGVALAPPPAVLRRKLALAEVAARSQITPD